MKKLSLLLIVVLTLISCDLLEGKKDGIPVARVNTAFLYEADIASLVGNSISKEDSAILVSSFINQWATEELLMNKALVNISEEQQKNYNKLVRQYKVSLFTEGYKNALVSRDLDSLVSKAELDALYNKDKANFLLNDELLKIRYVHLDTDNANVATIKKLLKNYTDKDKVTLSTMSLQFKAANLNDSVWVKKEALLSVLPIVDKNEVDLTSGRFNEIKDSTGIYIYKVAAKLNKGDVTPGSFIAPTLRQIILNKRKLELIRNIEKDITKDAIKNNNFEIYAKE